MIINTTTPCNQQSAIYCKTSVIQEERRDFAQILEQSKQEIAQQTASTSLSTQLPGDYIRSFAIANPTAADIQAKPQGLAAHAIQCKDTEKNSIDKTSELYQHALELESYLVKIMLNSMRSTMGTTLFTGKDSFAGKMYEDMMYEELSRTMTKNAGLGLADQIYIQLNGNVNSI